MPNAATAKVSADMPPRPHGVPPEPKDPHVEPPGAHAEPHGAQFEDEEDLGPDRESQLHELREKAQIAMEQGATWIRANPAAAVGLAVAGGFIVGRMLRK